MQAIVLTGGLGTRLRPLTYTVPKPLIPMLDRPIVDHILDRLPREVTRVVLASNYMIDQLREHFKESHRPYEVLVVDEPQPMGTGGAIKNAEKHLDEPFLVFNGDVITSLDVPAFAKFHAKKGGIGALAAWDVPDPSAFGIMDIGADGRIGRFKEKPKPDEVFSHWINAGTYLLEPEIFDHIPSGRPVSIEREVFPNILNRGLFGYPFKGYWVDCGKPAQYLDATRTLLASQGAVHTGRKARIDPSADIRPPVWLGDGCHVGEDAVIGPGSVVGRDASVGMGSIVEGSVVMPGAVLGERCVVRGSIVGGLSKLGMGCELPGDCVVGFREHLPDGTLMKPGERLPKVIDG